jgi:hypothetical protein
MIMLLTGLSVGGGAHLLLAIALGIFPWKISQNPKP